MTGAGCGGSRGSGWGTFDGFGHGWGGGLRCAVVLSGGGVSFRGSLLRVVDKVDTLPYVLTLGSKMF